MTFGDEIEISSLFVDLKQGRQKRQNFPDYRRRKGAERDKNFQIIGDETNVVAKRTQQQRKKLSLKNRSNYP